MGDRIFYGVMVLVICALSAGFGHEFGERTGKREGYASGQLVALHDADFDATMIYLGCIDGPCKQEHADSDAMRAKLKVRIDALLSLSQAPR